MLVLLSKHIPKFLRAMYMKATRAEGPLGSTIVLLDRVLLKKIKKIKTKGIFYKKI